MAGALLLGLGDDGGPLVEGAGAEPVVDIGIPGAAEALAMTVETGAAPEEVKPAKRAPARSSAVKKKATKRRRSSRDDSCSNQ